MLEHIYNRQKEFQKNFFNPDSVSREDKIKWTKEFVLCVHQELAEVMSSVDWKSYHMYNHKYADIQTKEEIIDVLKFVLNLCIIWGMDPVQITAMFNLKTDETIKRLTIKK